MIKEVKEIGVIVGRFQVPELHAGHVELIQKVVDNHKRVVIFLGVTPVLVTKKNPLDFITRKEMILKVFPNVTILALPDMPNDTDWSKELDKRLREVCPMGDALLYGGRDSFRGSYTGHFETTEIEQIANFSGTEMRKDVSQETKASPDFRVGVIFAAYNQYPKVYPTVDVAIMKGDEVLLGRKPHQTLFRFIGGFVDPTDDSFEQAAQREAQEETGVEVGNLQYVGTARIDDWRYRHEVDKIITTLFTADYVFGNAVAQDDIEELKWFKIKDLEEGDFVKEHRGLWGFLEKKIVIKN
jgi:bifunctional NMN adenylyltransferase/nudix hydrolase